MITEHEGMATRALETGGAPLPPGRHLVLLAEDDTSLRRMMAAVLAGDGFEVIEAADGLELLGRIEEVFGEGVRGLESFVVVADINMPGLTGMDVLAILRCTFTQTPVVLITAFADREVRREAIELGATALLDKPFSVDALRTMLARLSLVGRGGLPRG